MGNEEGKNFGKITLAVQRRENTEATCVRTLEAKRFSTRKKI